ncbi:MAG TPA: glycosyltransferase family 39 protein, partial [Chthoniobacterales bacterium]|nr:glycosyltransferase family 39 protein [Chthoniobacterales bacterium]
VIALNTVPIFNIGSFVITTDPISVFFWTAAMVTFWLALERSPQFSSYWPFTGFLIGLGFLGKYVNALQLASVVLVLVLVPRFRREFRRPGLYSLFGTFVICMLPPVIWNYQHAWATLDHLRLRGALDQAPGFNPLEVLSFVGMHFVVYSPLLFLALAWAVIASWPRARQQFKGVFLLSLAAPIFLVYFLISINKAANANWDAPAFISLGVLAASFWRERLESRPQVFRWGAAALVVGLVMSVLALNADLLRQAGIPLPRRNPADRIRGWRSASAAVEQLRVEIEAQLGEKVFVIADERDRASEFAFYFKDKRPEGPGHPPVYIVESQDIRNQFSFWPRYDEFVEAPPDAPPAEGDVFTETGVSLFQGRSAMYVQGNSKRDVPYNISRAFASVEPYRTMEVRRLGRLIRTLNVYICRQYRPLEL